MEFGRLLIMARRRVGLSQSELASRSHLAQPQVSNVERGRRRATDRYIGAVAPVLEMKPDRLRQVRDFIEIGGELTPGTGYLGYLAGGHDRSPTHGHVGEHPDPAAGTGRFLEGLIAGIQLDGNRAAHGPRDAALARRLILMRSLLEIVEAIDDDDVQRVVDFAAGLRAGRA